MPLRRTERSDGRQRPRWKDGSHVSVESTHANESRCDEIALEPNSRTEPLVTVPLLLRRNHEHEVSTRDRPARTGADARIEESAAMGEVRLALRPYGRYSAAAGSGREERCRASWLLLRLTGGRRNALYKLRISARSKPVPGSGQRRSSYQPSVPAPPLKGPTRSDVIQPP